MALFSRFQAAPLSSSFFLVSILGILIVLFYWNKLWGPTWNFTFLVLFIMMFMSSMISMNKAPIDAEIEIDHHAKKSKRR
jgi:hypothetical protein